MNAKNLSIGLASLALLALTSVASARQCIADANDDGYVGFNDLISVVSSWGACPVGESSEGEEPEALPCPADFSQDGRVDFLDLTLLLLDYGQNCSQE